MNSHADPMEETVDMICASRSVQNNVEVMNAAKTPPLNAFRKTGD